MKVLIIGANGQVGSELIVIARQREINYVSYNKAQLDITDTKAMQAVFDEQRPNIVINATAYTAVDTAESDEHTAFSVNRDGVENLAFLCQSNNIPLLHISTDFVFDGEKVGAYEEDDQANPLGIYGASKLAGEEVLRQTWEKHIILRTSWVYGVRGNNFVKTMLRLMRERDQLQVVDDQWGCPTSAQSIAATLLTIASFVVERGAEAWGTYHFCSSGRTNWYLFAKEILRLANEKESLDISIMPIPSEQWESPAARPKNSELSTKKLERIFGIEIEPWQGQLSSVISSLSRI